MNRTKTMFFAFIGNPMERPEKIFGIAEGYECWNLKNFTLDEFVEELQSKIPPVNKTHVLKNYKAEETTREPYGLSQKQFGQASWGLLIPDTLEEGGFSYEETLFILNLYSANFLYPLFFANDMGIQRPHHDKEIHTYFHNQDHAIFNKKEFITFYRMLFEQSKYASWNLNQIQTWKNEDWRLFTAVILFTGLKKYENSKTPFGWQRESAEMSTILEALFTADDTGNQEIVYRLCKRISVLLCWMFPNIEKDIRKELYKARSDFVHGSFFLQIAKDSAKADSNIPIPDFDVLYKHKEYVRLALVAYLYLAQCIKKNPTEYKNNSNVMGTLEESIMDIELRKKVVAEIQSLFSLMPKTNLKIA